MLSQCGNDCSPDHKTLSHTHRKKKLFYPKCGNYFTKTREGLEKCLEIVPMPDGLRWKRSQFEGEGEMKSKKYETQAGHISRTPDPGTGCYKKD